MALVVVANVVVARAQLRELLEAELVASFAVGAVEEHEVQMRVEPHVRARALCASLDGFTLHAATRAGALDAECREKLLRYVLRPPIAQERVELRPDGLVRIALKRAYADGTVAVDMDPMSLLCRLVAAGASGDVTPPKKRAKAGCGYRHWADLLRRTFALDVLECPKCKGRLQLVARVTEHASIARFLEALGEPTTVPERSPARGPPYWASTVLRRKALGDVA